MIIKSITLSGFRSFYRTQILTFDSGMTAIVGPDGCGKSNVIRGILWALAHPAASLDPTEICSSSSRHFTAKGAQVGIDYQIRPYDLEMSLSRTLSVNGLWATFNIDGHDYADSVPPPEFLASRAQVQFLQNPAQLDLALEAAKPGDLFLIDGIDDPSSLVLDNLRSLTASGNQVIAVVRSRAMMQIADQLIGVTMEEPGVSKFVPMRLRK
ncbi:AAA family ATPase [Haloferula chungangensis]|uniref:AAA family ATPase n=1 Tax=Haloferula chungangensis TaxID=1048331 RepID=A0ABW2L8F8_9BACT